MLYSIHKLYFFLLLILPILIIVSWLNVFFGNANYTTPNYLLTFVLPAIVVTYLLTLLASEYIDDLYHFTFSRILFTLVGLVVALFLCAWVFNAFGMNVTFLTAQLPSIHDNTQLVDPREIASKFYSFQLPYALAMIVIFYSTAGTLFKENNMFSSGTRERLIVNLKKVARRRSRQKKK